MKTMMYGMSVLFSQRERQEISARTKRGMEEAVRQKKYPSKAPMGYKRDNEGHLIIDSIGANVIKDIFNLYLKGNSASEIAKIMRKENRFINEENIGKWHDKRIGNILSNPIYKGELHWRLYSKKINDELIIPDFCEPIIEPSKFDLCQNQKNKYKHAIMAEKFISFIK